MDSSFSCNKPDIYLLKDGNSSPLEGTRVLEKRMHSMVAHVNDYALYEKTYMISLSGAQPILNVQANRKGSESPAPASLQLLPDTAGKGSVVSFRSLYLLD